MNLLATVSPLEDVKAEMLLVTVFQGEKELTGRLAWLDRILGGQIGRLLSTGEVRGQYYTNGILTYDQIMNQNQLGLNQANNNQQNQIG